MNEKDSFNYYSFLTARHTYMYLKNTLIYNKQKQKKQIYPQNNNKMLLIPFSLETKSSLLFSLQFLKIRTLHTVGNMTQSCWINVIKDRLISEL